MPAASDFREERAELEALLASGIFGRSPSLATFLQYICARYFEGKASEIKEYNVAVEAFGRPANFDQKRDSIVRVEAHRLRKRLQEYYSGPGADHKIHIRIPQGQYAPQFIAPAVPADAMPSTEPSGVGSSGASDAAIVGPVAPTAVPAPVATPSTAAATPTPLPVAPTDRGNRSSGQAMAWAAVAVFLCTAAGVWWLVEGRANAKASAAVSERTLQPTGAPMAGTGPADEVRIAAGLATGRYLDRLGNTWMADRYYNGGEAFRVPARPIARTLDAEMYLQRREGDFSYDIPLKPGTYELRLHFAETVFGENNVAGGGETSRLFDVSINGRMVLHDFDVISDAGGSNTANIKVFTDVEPHEDGYLHIGFARDIKERAFVNAIEIVPGVRGKVRPLRVSTRTKTYTDGSQNVWLPDAFFAGGQSIPRHERVTGTPDPELYQSERYGNFTYSIPVPQDREYTVTLKFAENWFGEGRNAGGGEGSRVFDVYCNGRALLRNFDIVKEAGGALKSVDRTFRGLQPTAQGKLLLQFIPVRNYALVNAIEVVAETR